ncbi:hypothetical protein [Lysinibacillus sp. JNUCC-52]|uniref:hypothetical protein n=1 Tax=Lysinibacillus sp. JNUCC-52 TaxID=2792480 RepID=UPI0019381B86|nr:hypothetical protein JNUCC52_02990 [Lysinibacillus sp. JNUCC-52]
MIEEKEIEKKKKRMDERDLKWLIGILIGIIILILTFRLGDNMDVVNLFSFISSAVSIALALVAILIALNQSRDNEELSTHLKTTMAIMNEKLKSVDEKVNKIDPDVLSRALQQKIDNVITDISENNDIEISAEEIEERYKDELNQLKLELNSVIENINSPKPVHYVPSYNIGDEVMHNKWGVGKVIDVKGDGDSTEVDVQFNDPIGKKRLLAKYAPIFKVR